MSLYLPSQHTFMPVSIFHPGWRATDKVRQKSCSRSQKWCGDGFDSRKIKKGNRPEGEHHRYTREIPEPVQFLSLHGAQIMGICIFPAIKITVIRHVRMYYGFSVKINMCEMPHGAQRSRTHFVCVCFSMCGRQNPNTPNLSPMADDSITQGSIQGLGSFLYTCGEHSGI